MNRKGDFVGHDRRQEEKISSERNDTDGVTRVSNAVFDRPQWRRMVKMVTGCEIGLVGKSETRRSKACLK